VLPEYVKGLFDRLDHMQEAGLPVYYIQGNHDLNKVPWMSIHKHPMNLHKKMASIGGTNQLLYGIQYGEQESVKEILSKVPECVNTLMMHQAETKAMPFGDNFHLNDVPTHVRSVLIGDIHAAQDYSNGPTHLYYPGSPCITSKEHDAARTFLLERAADNDLTHVERIPIPTRGVYHVEIQDGEIDALEGIVSQIAQNDLRHYGMIPLIFIHYPPTIAAVMYKQALILRERYDVYTWLEVDKKLLTENAVMDKVAPVKVNTGIPTSIEVINEIVDDEDVRRMLGAIFTSGDVKTVMQAELEVVL